MEVWSWLEAVVTWLNHEYVWDTGDVMPPCWPQHPHLVREIAVLADQRHRAGQALTSEALETTSSRYWLAHLASAHSKPPTCRCSCSSPGMRPLWTKSARVPCSCSPPPVNGQPWPGI